MELQFTQYIVKSYNNLNTELAKPWAQEPLINGYLTAMRQLATSISHFPEKQLVRQGVIERNKQQLLLTQLRDKYPSLSIIRDVSDMIKHGKLGKKDRNNSQVVCSAMEVRGDGMFRFLRNILEIKYEKSGLVYDFMSQSSTLINALIDEYAFDTRNYVSSVIENEFEFSNECILYFHHNREIAMQSTNLKFLKRDGHNNLIPSCPPKGRVGWCEVKNN